jgi:hypothetical protein
MKHAQVIQSKCNVKASRKDRDRVRKEESYGEKETVLTVVIIMMD